MLRRIVVLGVFLALIGALVWAGVATVRAFSGSSTPDANAQSNNQAGQDGQAAQSGQSGQENSQQSGARMVDGVQIPAGGELTPDGIVDADGVVTIPECSNNHLSMSVDSTRTDIGAGAQIPVSLKHNGNVACSFSAPLLQVKVESANSTIYDSSRCEQPSTEDAKILLMTPGKEWQNTLNWNGRIHNGCTGVDTDSDGQADVADADTYQVTVTLGQQQSSANIIVE